MKWRILFSQFRSPLMVILLMSMGLTFLIDEATDGFFILGAILINALVGFFQESGAIKRLDSLKALVEDSALVKKDGVWREVGAKDLRAGDVVKLSIGQKIPADGVILVADKLLVNEAILTGESVLIVKTKGSSGLMGCLVEQGIGEMEVVKVGNDTRLGSLVSITQNEIESSPFKRKLDKFSKFLAVTILVILAIFWLINLYAGRSGRELLPLVTALMVAAIPEGLVISVTVVLSMGMRRLLDQRAVVKSLAAAEALGSVTTICLDKTGTITMGKMKAIKAEALNKEDENEIYKEALLCNDYRDPLEYAMADYAILKLGKNSREETEKKYPRIEEEPFDPKKKIIITVHKTAGNKRLSIMSGAPEVVLNKSKVKSIKEKVTWEKKIKEAGDKGFRMVAFANRVGNDEYRFLGLILFVDPIREGVEESLREAKLRGINLKMITGDYKETAWVAMQGVGLVKKGAPVDSELVMTGEELVSGDSERIREKIHKAILFARTTPEQKLAIVKALQESGEVVGMMGDGVNDAPALKKSDIGITVFESSDAAREASDLVLLDSNFKTVVRAIDSGREIMVNVRRTMVFLLSGTFSTLFIILGTAILGIPFPLSTTTILLINLGVETLPSILISIRPGRVELGSILKPTSGGLVSAGSMALIFILGCIVGVAGLGLYRISGSASWLVGWLAGMPIIIFGVLRNGLFDNVIKWRHGR